jgi:hypothetical protein
MSRQPQNRRSPWRRGLLSAAVVVSAHLLLVLALVRVQAYPPPMLIEPEVVIPVALIEPPRPPPPPPVAAPAPPAPAKALPPPKVRPVPTPPPPEVKPVLVSVAPKVERLVELSDAQLAGAITAGSGPGGGGGDGSDRTGRACDMVRRLQAALRRDADVQAAVAQARRGSGSTGRAILVWNGDWIRSPDQEGKGLAGVRQAIMMEVAFAPEACRTEPMRGLVLISLSDGPSGARLALGSGAWRWSDLLLARSGGPPGAAFSRR